MNTKAEKIRRLVTELKLPDPEKAMGPAATSSLTGSIVAAAVGTLGLVLLMTIAVFVISGPPERAAEAAEVQEAAGSDPVDNQQPTTSTDNSAPAETVEPKSDTEKAVQKMGIGETKDPDSNEDELKNRLADLLKGKE